MNPREAISLFLSEFIGTAILLFVGCSSTLSLSGYEPSKLDVCLTFGMVVMFVVNIFGATSGGHLNPAVTITAVMLKTLTPGVAAIYIIAQLLGSVLGFGLLKALVPGEHWTPGLCTLTPHPSLSPIVALTWEFLVTSVLILFVCSLWDPRNARLLDALPLRLGFTITALAMAGGLLSGASMNPARVLGPALWNGEYKGHWIYWVGPILSGLVIPPFYQLVFAARKNEEETSVCESSSKNSA